jgi:hypothetical protein
MDEEWEKNKQTPIMQSAKSAEVYFTSGNGAEHQRAYTETYLRGFIRGNIWENEFCLSPVSHINKEVSNISGMPCRM